FAAATQWITKQTTVLSIVAQGQPLENALTLLLAVGQAGAEFERVKHRVESANQRLAAAKTGLGAGAASLDQIEARVEVLGAGSEVVVLLEEPISLIDQKQTAALEQARRDLDDAAKRVAKAVQELKDTQKMLRDMADKAPVIVRDYVKAKLAQAAQPIE